ncbi:DUF4946 domain-containing protein [Pseudomonas aeruginosa]|nr:DUF4946 domain-containing protein [Pseudomonas aeruginosa]
MARWPAGWQVSDLPAAQPGQAGAGQRQRAVKLQADGSQALVMEVTRMPLQSGQAVNPEKVLGHMRKLVQIEFLRNGLQTACTSPQPSTTGGLAALEPPAPSRQRGAVVMKQTLLAAAGKTSAYSLSYAGLAEAYDASQAEIRAVRESLRFGMRRNRTRSGRGAGVSADNACGAIRPTEGCIGVGRITACGYPPCVCRGSFLPGVLQDLQGLGGGGDATFGVAAGLVLPGLGLEFPGLGDPRTGTEVLPRTARISSSFCRLAPHRSVLSAAWAVPPSRAAAMSRVRTIMAVLLCGPGGRTGERRQAPGSLLRMPSI